MSEIQYIGEHLWPGKIGHFFIILGFVASLFSGVAYAFATKHRTDEQHNSWNRLGKIGFLIHGFCVFGIIAILFYIMGNQYYEYQYVQQHVSDDLPKKYMLSAFWEGQEGSFLLWMFWHVVLGFILMVKGRSWEAPVLSVLAFIQAGIGSMILGVYVFGKKIGINPTLLLRDVMDAPIFANADYVQLIKGTGLNPLLQNYWMTIHPPTLFLGFAALTIPFCYAIAALWTQRFKEGIAVIFPWALFAGAIMGTGILMGGAWAYEALSFGGYWAWDPVENTSLVPWIIVVAGIHTNIIARATGYSIKMTYVFYMLAFVMIVYSTLLTRSGWLGDTSVHAFTEMGLEWQLVLFNLGAVLAGLYFYFKNHKAIPAPEQEEGIASREFWMFIGSLVLLFSAVLISFTTSIPIYKKVAGFFGTDLNITSPLDPIAHYNKYQLWIGVFVAVLSGVAQFMRYREPNWSKTAPSFYKNMGISFVASLVVTFFLKQWIDANAWQYTLLLFTGVFAILTNLIYLITFIKGNLKVAGSTLSHMGFGIMIIGILASGLNKHFISSNPFAFEGMMAKEMLAKNVILFKENPMYMSGYEVVYKKDSIWGVNREFEVEYTKKDEKGAIVEQFSVFPNVLYDKSFTKIAASNPSTKHYLHKDIFSHVAALPPSELDPELAKEMEDSLDYQRLDLTIGEWMSVSDTLPIVDADTFRVKHFEVLLESVEKNAKNKDYIPQEGDISLGLNMKVKDLKSEKIHDAKPIIVLRGNMLYGFPAKVRDIYWKFKIPDILFDQVIKPEEKLGYQSYNFKEGDQIKIDDLVIKFLGFDKAPQHPDYKAVEGDIAVGALLQVTKGQQSFQAKPVYLLRGNSPFNLKDEIEKLGLHFRFNSIDPYTKSINIAVAQDEQASVYSVELAQKVSPTEYIVLEAIIFPGINFFWLGSCMMLFGLALSMFRRRKEQTA